MKFIGRRGELQLLEGDFSRPSFAMSTIYGRRRVGKTQLLQEFLKDKNGAYFVGIETGEMVNLELLSRAIYKAMKMDEGLPPFRNLHEALRSLFEFSLKEKLVFIMDEYPYLAMSSASISSILQMLIDEYKEKSKLHLILCGSSMSFMENQVLGYKSPLYGRRTSQIKVKPFDYVESSQFVPNFSLKDKAIVYGMTGGVAEYLSFVDDKKTLRENIIDLFLTPGGRLYEETISLLNQELRELSRYNDILYLLSRGETKPVDISNKLSIQTGSLNPYLKKLMDLGIIKRKTPVLNRETKRPLYIIEDTFFDFWFRFVGTRRSSLAAGLAEEVYDQYVEPYLHEFMGPVFEKMAMTYYEYALRSKKAPFLPEDYGPWWGGDKLYKIESEIDLLAVTKNEALFGECKWRNKKVTEKTLLELKRKSQQFPYPEKHYWLFSLTGFTEGIEGATCIDLEAMYSV